MDRHLLERCLLHFGYVHNIPRPIPNNPSEGIYIWFIGHVLGPSSAINGCPVSNGVCEGEKIHKKG